MWPRSHDPENEMTKQSKPAPVSPILRGLQEEGPQTSGRRAPLVTTCAEAEELLSPTRQRGYDAQRAALEPAPESAAEAVQGVGVIAIGEARNGLDNARIDFFEYVKGVFDDEFAQRQGDEMLFAFWTSLANLALPGVGAMLGLSSEGVSLILDTATLPAFEPAKDGGKAAMEAARGLVDGYLKGIDAQLESASLKLLAAAACFGHRDKSSLERKRLFISQLFLPEVVMGKSALVSRIAVRTLMFERMKRLFDLSTVGVRSVRAGSQGLTLDAKVTDQMAEGLLPGWRAKMQRHMPDRWRFWMEERRGRIAPVPFQRDLQTLGRLVRQGEFGIPAATTPEVRAR
jgi:hypothetical protein